MTITENLKTLRREIPQEVSIVAVSKTRSTAEMLEAYEAGQRIFGENKAREAALKQQQLPADIIWHFIGHLQTNKVKYIAPFITLIHSIDSLKLLLEVNREAIRNQRVIECLLQFHIASEETKFGLSLGEASELLSDKQFQSLHGIRITGVMGMATYTTDNNLIRKEFRSLRSSFYELRSAFFPKESSFREMSMGMSDDFRIAIAEGSTMVRIGSSIFGERAGNQP
jgi:pyridoxal phosphate enzyme (YggS family)